MTDMIKVTVHDVMLRAPKNDPEVEWLPGPRKKHKLGLLESSCSKKNSAIASFLSGLVPTKAMRSPCSWRVSRRRGPQPLS